MRILITNDDGIHAPGIAVLEQIAREFSDDIWVVAPSEEQSGAGHSLTLTRPLRLNQLGERRFSVSGTPTDSVMLAIHKVLDGAKPDLILSGVNRGANLAEDVTYSGTVSAAMEGALAGVRSIAFSQAYGHHEPGDDVSFATAIAWGPRVLSSLLDLEMPDNTLINVNFPYCDPAQVKGIRVVEQGFRDFGRLRIIANTDPRGFDYYWVGLGGARTTPAHATDLEAVADGYVAVTPLHLDLTHRDSLAMLASRFA